jgi:acyl-CoA reductase-like NAD-dependent aldehyde dehydrogenase
MNSIIESAVAAQKMWREVPVQQRVRVLIKFHTLLVANKDAIADLIVMCVASDKTPMFAHYDSWQWI